MITLLIPTMNRSDFLIRLLRYYRDIGFQGRICVGDSSEEIHTTRTRREIGALNGKLNIFYREYPGLDNNECAGDLLESVSTPYAVLLSDDDFLVPGSLERCAMFLESHPEYSAAHGLAGTFSLKSSGAYGAFQWVESYWQRPIEGENGMQRLLDHLGNYSVTLFSVHRTDQMRAMYRNVSPVSDQAFAEMLLCSLSVIQGKVRELDCLYLVRQAHDRMYSRSGLSDVYDWITNPDWLLSYQIFRDCLAGELARQDGISVEEAREVVKQAFWSCLAQSLTKKWHGRYTPNSRLREAARRVPGLRRIWRKVRSFIPGKENEMTLSALLRSSSPYHADFVPIYWAITTPPAELPGNAG